MLSENEIEQMVLETCRLQKAADEDPNPEVGMGPFLCTLIEQALKNADLESTEEERALIGRLVQERYRNGR